MEVEQVTVEMVIDKDISPATSCGDDALPRVKRRKQRKANTGESEVVTSKQLISMEVTKGDVPRTEILYAVSCLKDSEVEPEIPLTEGITELEPDPERPDLRFVLLKKTTKKNYLRSFQRKLSN